MSRSKEKWSRIKPMTPQEQLERIRIWDYVDSVEHCIDTTTLDIKLCTRDEMERNPNLESIENIEGGLEYAYGTVSCI